MSTRRFVGYTMGGGLAVNVTVGYRKVMYREDTPGHWVCMNHPAYPGEDVPRCAGEPDDRYARRVARVIEHRDSVRELDRANQNAHLVAARIREAVA